MDPAIIAVYCFFFVGVLMYSSSVALYSVYSEDDRRVAALVALMAPFWPLLMVWGVVVLYNNLVKVLRKGNT